ncbi:MAG: YihY/virulence factor BrkB family protein [Acidobacteria bacterium]|nr:YihY/virulence factor BrkB family protein [Acidobacteriota bacterium]
MNPRVVWSLLLDTYNNFYLDKVPRLAASLAYYTLFSLAPVLFIAVAVAGLVFGPEAARGEIVHQIDYLIGREGAEAIQGLLQRAWQPGTNVAATIVGIVTLLVGATGAFVELQDALNTIWGVLPKPGQGLVALLKVRLTSFLMILGIGFLLLVSLVISAGLAAATKFLGGYFAIPPFIAEAANVIVSLMVFTVLLAMIYKILPDVEIRWHHVWIGAALTAVLFTVGKFLIGLYLGRSSVTSTYGAAGSIVIILLWVYYSSLILFLGAEFTQVYASRFGAGVYPSKHAMSVNDVIHVAPRSHVAGEDSVRAAVKEQARRHVSRAAAEVDRNP